MKIESSQGPSGSQPLKQGPMRGKERTRDNQRCFVKGTAKVAGKDNFAIVEPARQQTGDNAYREPAESGTELAKAGVVTHCQFPYSPQRISASKARVAAVADFPDSSSSGSDSDNMSNHVGDAGGLASLPAPVPYPVLRLGIKVP